MALDTTPSTGFITLHLAPELFFILHARSARNTICGTCYDDRTGNRPDMPLYVDVVRTGSRRDLL